MRLQRVPPNEKGPRSDQDRNGATGSEASYVAGSAHRQRSPWARLVRQGHEVASVDSVRSPPGLREQCPPGEHDRCARFRSSCPSARPHADHIEPINCRSGDAWLVKGFTTSCLMEFRGPIRRNPGHEPLRKNTSGPASFRRTRETRVLVSLATDCWLCSSSFWQERAFALSETAKPTLTAPTQGVSPNAAETSFPSPAGSSIAKEFAASHLHSEHTPDRPPPIDRSSQQGFRFVCGVAPKSISSSRVTFLVRVRSDDYLPGARQNRKYTL